MWLPLVATIASILFGWRLIETWTFSWLRFSNGTFPRSFLLTKSVTQATKKILPGFVHILIVYHAVRRIIRKSIKLCFISTSKLLYERSITHISSTRSHFYVKFRLMYLVPICRGQWAFQSLSWLHGERSKCELILEESSWWPVWHF